MQQQRQARLCDGLLGGDAIAGRRRFAQFHKIPRDTRRDHSRVWARVVEIHAAKGPPVR